MSFIEISSIFKTKYEEVITLESEMDDLREYLERLQGAVTHKNDVKKRVKFYEDIIAQKETVIKYVLQEIFLPYFVLQKE